MHPASEITYSRPPLYPEQEAAIFSSARYSCIEASTKAGKTVGALAWLLEQTLRGKPGQNFWWVAPVYPQANIAFRRLCRGLTPGIFKANKSELSVEFVNDATLWFKSAEKPDNLYGEDVYAAVVDEASRVREDAWYAIRSTLTATRGPIRFIGNVKGTANWAYKMARRAERGDDPDLHYAKITWREAVAAGVLDPEEIERARRDLPGAVFRELYEAEAADLEGRIYYAFDLANIAEVEDTGGDLYVGMDFNVDPMCAVIGVKAVDELHILDEIEIRNSGTEEMAQEVLARIETAEWVDERQNRTTIVCPDPSGNARKTSAPVGQTDFTILKRYGFKLHAPKAAPPDRRPDQRGQRTTVQCGRASPATDSPAVSASDRGARVPLPQAWNLDPRQDAWVRSLERRSRLLGARRVPHLQARRSHGNPRQFLEVMPCQ